MSRENDLTMVLALNQISPLINILFENALRKVYFGWFLF